MTVVVQISDAHLSRQKPHFVDSWDVIASWLQEQQPSLIIHSGDITVDGAYETDDLICCADWSIQLKSHSVSSWKSLCWETWKPEPASKFRALGELEEIFRKRSLALRLGGMALIGFNSMILGSDLAKEEVQFQFVKQASENAGGP